MEILLGLRVRDTLRELLHGSIESPRLVDVRQMIGIPNDFLRCTGDGREYSGLSLLPARRTRGVDGYQRLGLQLHAEH
jgi:hypothetical protein